MPKITNDGWHRMLYRCTHMATVGVRGFNIDVQLRKTMVSPAYLGARSRWLTVQQAVVMPEKPMATLIRITARITSQLT